MSNILRVSEAAALALHTVALLAAGDGKPRSTRSIASTFEASEFHLAKVLQRLTRAGFVRSARGPRGGFTLVPSTAEATLLDVFETIEGRFTPSDCLLGDAPCGADTCVFGGLIKSTNRRVHNYLAKTTIAQLAERYEPIVGGAGRVHRGGEDRLCRNSQRRDSG